MLVYPSKHAVLIGPREAASVLNVMPHAKRVTFRNKEILAVPHRLDESKVLRNLGIQVPSPILHYYDWPRSPAISAPFEAQRETAAFFTLNSRAHCHNGLGSGKTLASLWAFDYLRSVGRASKALVIATLSTLEPAWADSLDEHLPHLKYRVLFGPRKKRLMLLDSDADIYIVNHDGATILTDELRERDDIDCVIIDEIAQCARNARTDRWRALDSITNAVRYVERPNDGSLMRIKTGGAPKRWVWGLTGTPIPNAPTDAYAQAKLITPDRAPRRFTAFRDSVMFQASTFRWVAREGALDEVNKILSPAIRFSREECIDLPPTTYAQRFVPLTKDQQKAYEAMLARLVVEAQEGKISAANEGVKASKLVQIACGSAYTSNGTTASFNAIPRMEEILNLVNESETKTLVFVPFVSAVHTVTEYLRKNGIATETIYGDVPKKDRDRIFGLFQHTNSPQVIVAQPAAMAHGLTLVRASTIVWFAPTFHPDVVEQANARITRPGQKHNTLIVSVWGSAIEKKMYQRLRDKQSMQGILLDMIRNKREPTTK